MLVFDVYHNGYERFDDISRCPRIIVDTSCPKSVS